MCKEPIPPDVVCEGARNLTEEEINDFHMSTIKLSYPEALDLYKRGRNCKLGRLFYNREVPVLEKAKEILDAKKEY